jgi:hypothetical protein
MNIMFPLWNIYKQTMVITFLDKRVSMGVREFVWLQFAKKMLIAGQGGSEMQSVLFGNNTLSTRMVASIFWYICRQITDTS